MRNADFGVSDGVANVNFIRWTSLADNDRIAGAVFGVASCRGGVRDRVSDRTVGTADAVDVPLGDRI